MLTVQYSRFRLIYRGHDIFVRSALARRESARPVLATWNTVHHYLRALLLHYWLEHVCLHSVPRIATTTKEHHRAWWATDSTALACLRQRGFTHDRDFNHLLRSDTRYLFKKLLSLNLFYEVFKFLQILNLDQGCPPLLNGTIIITGNLIGIFDISLHRHKISRWLIGLRWALTSCRISQLMRHRRVVYLLRGNTPQVETIGSCVASSRGGPFNVI